MTISKAFATLIQLTFKIFKNSNISKLFLYLLILNVTDKEILHKKTAAEIRIGEFTIAFSNNHLNMKIKLFFYNCYVLTRLCYGTHTWNLSQKQRK